MTFFIETDKDPCEGRNVVFTRNNVRSCIDHTNIIPSGENTDHIENNSNIISENDSNNKPEANMDDDNDDSLDPSVNDGEDDENNSNIKSQQPSQYTTETEINVYDDAHNDPYEGKMVENRDDEADTVLVAEKIENTINASEEDYEFRRISDHCWESGMLILTIELESGKSFDLPFSIIKKDKPIELGKYIKGNVV